MQNGESAAGKGSDRDGSHAHSRRAFLKVGGGSGIFAAAGGGASRCFRPRCGPRASQSATRPTLSPASPELASSSAIASYNWKNRGKAPAGYIKGMAVSYAKVYYDLGAGNANAVEMAKAMTADASKDALKHYEDIFQKAGMDNTKDGENTLHPPLRVDAGPGNAREQRQRYCEAATTQRTTRPPKPRKPASSRQASTRATPAR